VAFQNKENSGRMREGYEEEKGRGKEVG